MKQHKYLLMLALLVAFLPSCASIQPTTETFISYRIYEVPKTYSLTEVRDAVIAAAKSENDGATVANCLPPHPLPLEHGRFELKNVQVGPMTMQIPQMPNATVTVQSQRHPSAGESMNWIVGIYPYANGYSVQMLMTARYQRGTSSFNPVAVGAALGRDLLYEQNGGIEGRIKYWFDNFAKKTSEQITMKLEEAYPNEQ